MATVVSITDSDKGVANGVASLNGSGDLTADQIVQMAANTVKVNNTGSLADQTDLAMAASTFLARLAAGNIVAATVAEVKTLLGVTDDPSWSAFLAPAQITANQNNYSPAGWDNTVNRLELTSDGNRDITGLVATGFDRTHSVMIVNENASSGNIKLKSNSGSSTAANQFKIQSDLTIEPGEVQLMIYSPTSSKWLAVTTVP